MSPRILVERLHVRCGDHLVDPREAIQRLLTADLPPLLASLPYDSEEIVAVERLAIGPVAVGSDRDVDQWARAVSESLARVGFHGGSGDVRVVRFAHPVAAATDLVRRTLAGDTSRRWAFRLIGWWPESGSDQASAAAAVAGALSRVPHAAPAIIARIAAEGLLQQLLDLLGRRLETVVTLTWGVRGRAWPGAATVLQSIAEARARSRVRGPAEPVVSHLRADRRQALASELSTALRVQRTDVGDEELILAAAVLIAAEEPMIFVGAGDPVGTVGELASEVRSGIADRRPPTPEPLQKTRPPTAPQVPEENAEPPGGHGSPPAPSAMSQALPPAPAEASAGSEPEHWARSTTTTARRGRREDQRGAPATGVTDPRQDGLRAAGADSAVPDQEVATDPAATAIPVTDGTSTPVEPAPSAADSEPEPWFDTLRSRGWTRWAGILFLVHLLPGPDLDGLWADVDRLPTSRSDLYRLGTAIIDAARPPGSQLATTDPALLAFAGLAPDQPVPDPDEEPVDPAPWVRTLTNWLRSAFAAPHPWDATSNGDNQTGRHDATSTGDRAASGTLTLGVPAVIPGTGGPETDRTLLERVVARHGEIVVDPGWIDVELPLDQVSVPVRAIGLDLNPGWVPSLGAVVRFRYV